MNSDGSKSQMWLISVIFVLGLFRLVLGHCHWKWITFRQAIPAANIVYPGDLMLVCSNADGSCVMFSC